MKKYIWFSLLLLVACDYLPAGGNKNIIKLSKDVEHYSDDMIPADIEPNFSQSYKSVVASSNKNK